MCWSQAILSAVYLKVAFPKGAPADAPPAGTATAVAAAAGVALLGVAAGVLLQGDTALEALIVPMGIPLLVIATVMTFGPYYDPKPQPW